MYWPAGIGGWLRANASSIGSRAVASDKPAAGRHRVARVEREVDHRLLDLSGIAEHRAAVRQRELGLHLDVSRRAAATAAAQIAGDRLVEIEHARLEQLLAAEGQQLARHRSGALGGAPDLLDVGARRMIRRHFAERELRVAGDRGQRVVQVVGDAARQPADRFHLLRLPQLILEQAPLGDVLHGADHPQRPPLRDRERRLAFSCTQRTLPSGRTTRCSKSYGCPPATAVSLAACTAARSSGCTNAKNGGRGSLELAERRRRRCGATRRTSRGDPIRRARPPSCRCARLPAPARGTC